MKLCATPLVGLLLVCIASGSAHAFKPQGHEQLEAIAYQELAADKDTPAVLGERFSGPEVLEALKDTLRRRAPDGGPAPGSGSPDSALERQFDMMNQAYHFMAESADVRAAAGKAEPRQALLERALPDNLALMRLLFNETVLNPEGAFDAGRGIYVLLHQVGDAFSREHVERDADNRLLTIKGWKLLGWDWPEAATRAGEKKAHDGAPVLALLHNAGFKGADWDWQETSGNGELTLEGRRAVTAMKSLLVTIHAARKAPARQDALWAAFVEEHFNSAVCPLQGGQRTCAEPLPLATLSLQKQMSLLDADSFPSWQFGLGGGAHFSRDGTAPFAQLLIERHVVPWAATSLYTRLRYGGTLALRRTLTTPERLTGARPWHTATEAVAQASVSTMLPYLWLGASVGPGLRSDEKLVPGLAVSTSLTYYFRPYLSLSARYEHDWWLSRGQTNLLSLGASFYLVHAREVKGVTYPKDSSSSHPQAR